MDIRPYSPADLPACQEILEGNTPEYFARDDLDALNDFLENLPGPYFVAEGQGGIVACGGWAVDPDQVAVLTWGMVRRDLHRRGIGRALLRYRLDAINDETAGLPVRLRTVPQVQGFFAREGFVVVDVVPDGYGPGFDLVTMELRRPSAKSESVFVPLEW